MAHAQKLIPIEQLLSDVSGTLASSPQRPAARPSIVGGAPISANSEARRPEPPAARSNYVSPFAADSARKGTPRQEDQSDVTLAPGPRIVAGASQPEPVIMGSAALNRAPEPDLADHYNAERIDVAVNASAVTQSPPAATPRPPEPQAQSDIERLQSAVLQALTDGNQRILVSMLSAGEWSVQGNELVIKVAESQTVVDMSLGPDGKRLAIASASGVLGRAIKLRVVPGATVAPQESKPNGGASAGPAIGGRGRAEQDPVVQRMREKFGAEIRTVIDYKEKR
jgi:DNA polymerase-3 subunit gamma/tau